MSWPAIVFGWPAIGLAIGFFILGFLQPRSLLGYVGFAVTLPFLYYTSKSPRGLIWGPALLVLTLASAEYLRRGRRRPAALCLAPLIFVVAMLALYVATEG